MLDNTTARPNVEAGDLSKTKLNTGPTTEMAMASYKAPGECDGWWVTSSETK